MILNATEEFYESVDRLVYSIPMRGKMPRKFRRYHTMSAPAPKGTALITGASTGIGAVYADRLANAVTISSSLRVAWRSSLKLPRA
jgi:hypothetical protein